MKLVKIKERRQVRRNNKFYDHFLITFIDIFSSRSAVPMRTHLPCFELLLVEKANCSGQARTLVVKGARGNSWHRRQRACVWPLIPKPPNLNVRRKITGERVQKRDK